MPQMRETETATRDVPELVVTYPNRDSPAARAMRATVTLLLILSGVLVFVITFGAWSALTGAIPLTIVIGLVTLFFAKQVAQWRSGVLPVAAGLAIVSGIFSAASIQGWFQRDGQEYASPALPEPLIGVLVAAYTVIQVVLIVACLRAFQQQWQVEVEVPAAEAAGRH